MTSKDEVLVRLNELSEELNQAREALLKGQIVPIDNVIERINHHCATISEMEPDDAIAVKPTLDELLLNFQTFSQEIEYVQNKVKELLAAEKNSDADDNETGPGN